ncbi:NAD(+)/NADH kinase [bacterium]|nr:NAD(+)/NADH kinase [bacterium]
MKFGIVFYSKNLKSCETCIKLVAWLSERKLNFAIDSNSRLDPKHEVTYLSLAILSKESDFLIVIGGDGSILRASRHCAQHKTVLIGIHRGTKGFLTQLNEEDMFEGLERVLDGNYTIQNRLMIQASIFRKGKRITSFFGLNDAVLKVGSLSRIVNFQLFVNDVFVEEYPGDGILVSTPTGSTGYSLSTGGPIVRPGFDVLLMSPICTHKFNARPMIFSKKDVLKVLLHQENSYVQTNVILTIDGQVGYRLDSQDEIIIKAASQAVKIAEIFPQDFFKQIRTKI